MKIKICMLPGFGYSYDPKMEIGPEVGIPSYITNFGHKVTWILFSEEIKEVQETTFNGVRVFIVPHISYFKGHLKIFNRVLHVFREINFISKNFKQENYNLIFAQWNISNGLLALHLKRKYKIPFVFGMYNPIEQTWCKFYFKHKYFWYFITRIETYLKLYILHKADLVLPISKWLMEDFVKKGIEKSKMMPLPEGIDPDRFSDANGDEIRKRYRLEDSKVVIYVGTLDKLRNLDVLLHAFSKVRANKENVKLLMIGDGTDKPNLKMLANELGIVDDVTFTGRVDFPDIPNFIATADIGVSPVPPLAFYKVSSPTKMFEYMALGKPVVANEEIPEQKEVIEESGGGILVKFEAESFAEAIIELLDNQEQAKEKGIKGYEWVMKNRSYEVMAKEVEKRYFDVLRG